MTPAKWLAIALLVGVVAFGAGRYAAPSRVEVRSASTNSVQSAAVAVSHDTERETVGPVRIVTVTRMVPADCPRVAGANAVFVPEVTVTEERGPVVIERVDDDTSVASTNSLATSTASTVTAYKQPRLMLQMGSTTPLGSLSPSWDVSASYRLAGPVWAGAVYESTGRVGLRVGLTF